MDTVFVKTTDGKTVQIDTKELLVVMFEAGFKVFGMDLATIAELRKEYLSRKGPLDMTPQTVRMVFENK